MANAKSYARRNARRLPAGLLVLLVCAAVLRIGLTLVTEGYSTDVACFTAWAQRLADLGPGQFYSPDYFADYPPGYMLVLWVLGSLGKLLGMNVSGKGFVLLLSSVPILCDVGLTALVWHIARTHLNEKRAMLIAALVAFCPAFLYDTAVWKQVDSVPALCLVGVFWLLSKKNYLPAALLYGLALAMKPQALLFGPVLAVCFALPLFTGPAAERGWAVGRAVLGAVLSVAVVLAFALPFWGDQPMDWLVEKYTGTVSSYPYASVNGFNLITLLGGNWTMQTDGIFGTPITWQMLGTVGILIATAAMLYLAWVSVRSGRFCPMLLAGFYGAAIFCLSHRMHERYLIPALALLLAAVARWADRKLLTGTAVLSMSTLLNLALVLASNGTEDQFLTSDTARVMIAVVSLANLVGTVMVWLACLRLCRGGKICALQPSPEPAITAPAPQPRWTRPELLWLLAGTLLVGVVSLTNLGDFTAPQNPEVVQGTRTYTVQVEGEASSLWIYPEINWNGQLTVTDSRGTELVNQTLDYGNVFHWLSLPVTANETYTITLTDASVMELAFKNDAGECLTVTGESGALFDEQAQVPDTISYKNSMYFDEIYHGRTAYEHLHGMPVYETTHPPLGKVFIMLGIAVFGMTGFGWRVAGALFGIALVPVLYLFVRRLTRSPRWAGFAALLAGLDLMRYAQSRIATIDIYGTFFILLGAYFMLWYCQSMLTRGVDKSILPMALAGVAFGLGAASKWTGIYAGAGLAVLYFGVLWARWRQKKPNFGRELAVALVGGVLFFVLVPLIIYIAAYLPYWWREGGFSLGEWWQCQLTMFNYHSQLKSTHPYESNWYTWPLLLRPVWYYSASGLPAGMRGTIAGMGNPIVWWAALAGLCALVWRQISGRACRAQGSVLVLYLAQLLPWVLVTRCTFLYHYFPSLWFAVAGLALMLSKLDHDRPRLARRLALGILVAAAVVFLWFYPAVTGIPVSETWIISARWLPSWFF